MTDRSPSQQDWRVYIDNYERNNPESVLRIEREVDRVLEPTAIVMELEKAGKYPVVIFEHIAGSEFPVVANLLATRQRLGIALGVDGRDVQSTFAERIKNAIEPAFVDDAPWHANYTGPDDLDLNRLPILKHFPIDAGPYITAGLVTARDPVSGADTCGYHRMQLKGPQRLGISLHSRQRLWEYHRRAESMGVNLPAAIVLGVHPAISLGSMALVPYEQGKFARMGGLFNEPLQVSPCRDIDISAPTWAEIVIEGEILSGIREPEGPFAEFTGYSCFRSTENVFVPKSVSFRDRARYQCITPGLCAEHVTIVALQREGDVLKALHETLPNVKDVHAPLSACGLFHCYVSMKKIAEGQPMQAIMAAFAVDHNVKLVIVVDDDIDVFDESRVMWAVATRVQADRDILVIPQHQGMGCTLDPSTDDLSRSAKMGIDATRPRADFAETIALDDEAQQKARDILAGVGFL